MLVTEDLGVADARSAGFARKRSQLRLQGWDSRYRKRLVPNSWLQWAWTPADRNGIRATRFRGSRSLAVKRSNCSRARAACPVWSKERANCLSTLDGSTMEAHSSVRSRASWKAAEAPTGSDNWTQIWPRISSARASRPGISSRESATFFASESRSSRKNACSSSPRDSESGQDPAVPLCQSLIARSTFWERDAGLTEQEVIPRQSLCLGPGSRISPRRS